MRATGTVMAFAIFLVIAAVGRATEQELDILVLGNSEYGIQQSPMSQFWHLELEPPQGRLPKPRFESTRSSNWGGYSATWTIKKGQLFLAKIEGSIDGKLLSNEQIINKPFPLHAKWYNGKIFVPLGGYSSDYNRRALSYVVEFEITAGQVVEKKLHDRYDIPQTLDGLSYEPPRGNSASQSKDETD